MSRVTQRVFVTWAFWRAFACGRQVCDRRKQGEKGSNVEGAIKPHLKMSPAWRVQTQMSRRYVDLLKSEKTRARQGERHERKRHIHHKCRLRQRPNRDFVFDRLQLDVSVSKSNRHGSLPMVINQNKNTRAKLNKHYVLTCAKLATAHWLHFAPRGEMMKIYK